MLDFPYGVKYNCVYLIPYSLDPFPFTLSRIAMMDIFLFVFLISTCVFTIRYIKEQKLSHLYLTGLFMGLAVSVKWTVLAFNLLLLLCVLVVYVYRELQKTV